jgi:dGTPase
MLNGIYDAFLEKPDLLPRQLKEDAEHDGLERTVCDYLAGMTDRYAMDLYAMLYQPYVRTTDWF